MSENEGQAKKPYRDVLEAESQQGRQELRRKPSGLALSGLSAGLDVSFSTFFACVVASLFASASAPLQRVAIAVVYPIGFLFVVLGRSELFTEHTTLAAIPVIERRASLWSLARLWSIIWVTNIVGAFIASWLIAYAGPSLSLFTMDDAHRIAEPLLERPFGGLFVGAVFAGWLMGLLSWLVAAGKDTTSQVLVVLIVTAGIGLAELPHSISGTTTVLVAIWSGTATFVDWLRFIAVATAGNSVGGVVFVAIVKVMHVRAGMHGVERERHERS